MRYTKLLGGFIVVLILLAMQVRAVAAAPARNPVALTGTVQSMTLETDINSAVTTISVTLLDKNGASQTVRLSVEGALALRLVIPDQNGTPVLNPAALGTMIQIDPAAVIPTEEGTRHPVGNALATFFSDVTDYETIMKAYEAGAGFRVIAQALWLTEKLNGDSDTFLAILKAKETGDYSGFSLEDGSIPLNWGQFKKAVLNSSENGSGDVIISNHSNPNNESNGNGNGHGNGHGNGNNNENDKEKGK